jgi:hypothetical protein
MLSYYSVIQFAYMGALNLHIILLADNTIKDVVDTPGTFLANLVSHQLYMRHTHRHQGPQGYSSYPCQLFSVQAC